MSYKDIIDALIKAPISTILCLAGVLSILGSFGNYSKIEGPTLNGDIHWGMTIIGIILVLAGILMYKQKDKGSEPSPEPSPESDHATNEPATLDSPDPNQYPYGIKFNKVVWRHYYFSNYDFKAEMENTITNVSAHNSQNLPPEQAGWFGEGIEHKFTEKIFGADEGKYKVEKIHTSKKIMSRDDICGENTTVTELSWRLQVKPALPPGKKFCYGQIIETKATEHDAFLKGSFGGIAFSYPVDELQCEFYAPEGFRFLNDGFIVRDGAGVEETEDGYGEPEFSGDGGSIKWNILNPKPTLRYIVRIKIVKRD